MEYTDEGFYNGTGLVSFQGEYYHSECLHSSEAVKVSCELSFQIGHLTKCRICGKGLLYEPSEDNS